MVNKMATKIEMVFRQLSAILCLLHIHTVGAYYCDNDRCTEEEYCCGDNTCCPSYKVWDLWYFWCGVLFFLFLLSMCACLWRYRFVSSGGLIVHGYNYTALQEVDTVGSYSELSTSYRYAGSKNKFFTPPIGKPPPYNHVSAGSVKMASPPPSYAQVVGMRESP